MILAAALGVFCGVISVGNAFPGSLEQERWGWCGLGWLRTGGATARELSRSLSGSHMDTPLVGVLLHRDTKVTPEVGVERVLQLPGVNCSSG